MSQVKKDTKQQCVRGWVYLPFRNHDKTEPLPASVAVR